MFNALLIILNENLEEYFSSCHVGSWTNLNWARDACLIIHISFHFIFLNIRFHIVRHSNEDNIGNGITLHHGDVANKHLNKFFWWRRKTF